MIDLYFSGELEIQIMKYCKKLEVISDEYDVLIFMARKAICFYDALVLNNMVKTPNPEVVITTSSRILSYDCEFLKGKRIALLDDIVLKGKTLNETIKFLLEKEINDFDIFYIASQSFESENLKQIRSYLKEPILELESSEILILSNAITNYINASACSYNVDYPVFYLNSADDFYSNYILKNNCATIPSSNQDTKSSMYVQNFDCYKFFEKYDFENLKALKNKETEVILKLRFFYRPESSYRTVVVIPIVVLPELCANDIKAIFESVASIELLPMVKNTDENKEIGNMINVIQYILSYQLFKSVFQDESQYEFIYSVENQNYIFPQSYNKEIKNCLKKWSNVPTTYLENLKIIDDYFALSEVYRYFFDYIGEKHQKDNEHKTKFSFKEIFEYCNSMLNMMSDELRGYISIIFDYSIDSGLIVPEFNNSNGKYIRCYRLSEQYELQEKEFDLIIYMYNEYQNKTQKKEMNSILVEKLLVLFFKEVIMKILKSYSENQDESEKPKNLFGITYARFGPVVSDNASEIGVSKDSYLTTRLFDDSRSPYKRLYNANRNEKYYNTNERKNSKIFVKEVSGGDVFKYLPDNWKHSTRLFVNRYDYYEKILDFYNVFDEVSFINTFDQFLTISAIGDSKDNQLLSLAAELKIYQTKIAHKQTNEEIIVALDSIMDGMESGIWKYICYKTNEHKNCYKVILNSIKEEKKYILQCNDQIARYRNDLDKLKMISESSIDSLKENVNSFLEVYIDFCSIDRSNKYYAAYVGRFNQLYKNKDECKKFLNFSASKLREKVLEKLDEIYRKKDDINQEYVDIDRLDNLFTDQNSERNRNKELQNIVEKLMDESVIVIYEIINKWNYIIDYEKQGNTNVKIGYKDKNINYLKNAKSIFERKGNYSNRLLLIENACDDLESTIARLKEIVYEIDLLLYCINQYILTNSSKFIPIHGFYILRRDDGNEIESDEILSYKHKESSLNTYFGFESSNSYAAFIKSPQSTGAIDRIADFTGYTLVDYECTRGCNTIIKLGDNCYSKRVKKIIGEVLKENTNKKIEITDEW